MKKQTAGNKIISILIVCCFLLGMCTGISFADEELKENSWRYKDGVPIEIQVENSEEDSDIHLMSTPTMKGIDVSKHQGVIDWDSVYGNIDYAIIRCGYGSDDTSQDDSQWINNANACTRLGIPFGVYIYSYANTVEKAKSEAQHVLRLVDGYNLSFPIYFDMEDNVQAVLSASERGAIAQTFCDAIQAAGYEVGIYANKNWWENYLTDSVFNNSSWYKWVAQYNTSCTYSGSYTMWQYTSSGSVNGISGNVDMNYWYGEWRNVNSTVSIQSNEEVRSRISSLKSTMDGRCWNAGKSESELISAMNRGDYSFGLTDSCCSLSINDAKHHLKEYGCTSNTFNDSRQCAGFAYYMGYAVFGSKVSEANGWTKYTSSSGITLEPGDIIRYGGHSAMVWYTEGDTLYVAEANWWDKQSRWCQVHFGSSWSSVSYVLNNLEYIWKHPSSGTVEPTPVDFGTDFYAYILNLPVWKPIECANGGGNVYLATDTWTANQRWYFKRNDDGSYTFINAKNNLCLDVANSGNSDGTNVQAVAYNGSDAQKWFIYSVNGQYIFKPKCSDKVLDLNEGASADGTNIQLWSQNGSDAQSFDIYKVDCVASKPEIKSNVVNMNENGSATISWNATEYTDYYRYYLAEYPEGYAYSTNTTSGTTTNTSVIFYGLTSGKYSCFIHAISHQGKWSDQSNWKTFNVYADDYIPTKTVVSNNHIYALYDYEMSWSFARDLCEDLGGNLVTVTSAEENKIITDLIQSGSKDAYWLGATDFDREEKDFVWVTGEEYSYSNWDTGEPSSSGENGEKEHFAEIRKSYDYKWNDVNNINKSDKGFILEIDMSAYSPIATENYNGNQYLLFDKNTTWTEAKVFCEQLGGHLVTADDSAENEFVQNFLKNGQRGWYYLGGQKENNVWKWIDGSEANSIVLADNADAWSGTNLMMYKSSGKCIGLHNAYYPESDIDKIGFVCEIEDVDVAPTVTPTPTPTLTPAPTATPTPTETPTACFKVTKYDSYADVENIATESRNAVVIIAKYDGETLEKVNFTKVTFTSGEKRTFMFDTDGDYKVFVWDSIDGMFPLTV